VEGIVTFSLPYQDAGKGQRDSFPFRTSAQNVSFQQITMLEPNLAELLPGSCRTMPFISRSKRVARSSEEFKPDRSTMSSM
jgi:hypothetical protein